MTVELIRATALSDDVPYAYAAVVGPGSLVFTAGACPLDDDGAVVAVGDVTGQAERVMANLVTALAASGCTLADVAKSTVYVASADRADLVGGLAGRPRRVRRPRRAEHPARRGPARLRRPAGRGRGGRGPVADRVCEAGGVEESRRERFEEVAPGLIEPLRRFLARRTDPATAEDVLAETLLVCWRRAADLPDEPLPWAYGVARNCLRNAERSARRQERVAARLAAEPVDAGPPDDPALHEALAALRPDDAELLRLWAWEQLTPSEIATVLDITTNAVSIRLHRAREKLAAQLRKIQATSGHEAS